MKKLLFLSLIALLSIRTAFADDIVTKDESKLPVPAKEFINKYFSDVKISYIKIDNEFMQGKKYEVLLTNGTEVEFDGKGQWKEVNCKRKEVPAGLIPAYAKDYVAKNFNGEFITKIEKERRGIEIELNNDINIKFNNQGTVIELDD